MKILLENPLLTFICGAFYALLIGAYTEKSIGIAGLFAYILWYFTAPKKKEAKHDDKM